MIDIVYPVYQDQDTPGSTQDTPSFESLKIAGDFNNWQIEPMVKDDTNESKPVWKYHIGESQLKNCNKTNDRNDTVIHFKFIDDNDNWFIVPDYTSEPDEHNNINNVKIVISKQQVHEEEGEQEEEKLKEDPSLAKTDIVDEGPETPEPSLKDEERLTSQEPIIEEPEATSVLEKDGMETREDDQQNVIIEEQDDDNGDEEEPQEQIGSEADIPDEIIEESEPDTKSTDNVQELNSDILEECPDKTPDIVDEKEQISNKIPSPVEISKELNIPQEQEVSSEQNAAPVINEDEDKNPPSSIAPQSPNTTNQHADDEFFSPRKFEDLDSNNMLDSPVAPVAVAAVQEPYTDNTNADVNVDVENRDLTIKDKNSEEYQNILRRLLRGFCSWFSWLFRIFHSPEDGSH